MSKVKRNIRITLAVCLVWVLFVGFLTYNRYADNNRQAAAPLPGENPMVEMSTDELREIGARVYDAPIELSGFSLLDHNGDAFTETDLVGQWSLIFFGFTNCPDICPLTMHELGGFYNQLEALDAAGDTDVIMVSVDPFRDDTEAVAQYVKGFHEDFIGVTGEFEEISNIARQLYIAHSQPPATPPEGNYLVDHSGNILLINPEGQYHGFLESGIRAENIRQAFEIIRNQY